MPTEQVRMWRPIHEDRVLFMAGETTSYAMNPRGEYVFGIVTEQPMRSRRGGQRRLVFPGQLVAWDPSGAHSGVAIDGRPWTSRLMVIEAAHLETLANDAESAPLRNVGFPDPVISDPQLAGDFLELHAAFEGPGSRLETDNLLASWLRALIESSRTVGVTRSPVSARDDRGVRLALDYLCDEYQRNVGLDELAAVAGIAKFRLLRLIRERTGLPPHSLQVALRIRKARRLLESGHTIAETAAATGFADQSHLHRHFQRSLGPTPREYQRHFTA